MDEADHMLDMGFIHDIKKVIAQLPQRRQSLFFSATMPKSIVELSGKILGNPEKVTIKPKQATAEKVDQALYFVTKPSKTKLLIHLIEEKKAKSTLVFSRTKHGADKIVKNLLKVGIKAAAIHGNKAQNARQRALNAFKVGDLSVLVATDIAARGIDVDDLSLVINFDLPNVPETYVHRIGRTGRAKASGIALSFCDAIEKADLKEIEKLIKQKVPVISDHPFAHEGVEQAPIEKKAPQQQRSRHSNSQRHRGGGSRNNNNNNNSGGKKKSWKERR